MTIEQTIEIPADRRLVIEIPETFTSGTVSIILCDTPKAKAAKVTENIHPAETAEYPPLDLQNGTGKSRGLNMHSYFKIAMLVRCRLPGRPTCGTAWYGSTPHPRKGRGKRKTLRVFGGGRRVRREELGVWGCCKRILRIAMIYHGSIAGRLSKDLISHTLYPRPVLVGV
jgi:hypothetical protein